LAQEGVPVAHFLLCHLVFIFGNLL
jgi:hypothetical protein